MKKHSVKNLILAVLVLLVGFGSSCFGLTFYNNMPVGVVLGGEDSELNVYWHTVSAGESMALNDPVSIWGVQSEDNTVFYGTFDVREGDSYQITVTGVVQAYTEETGGGGETGGGDTGGGGEPASGIVVLLSEIITRASGLLGTIYPVVIGAVAIGIVLFLVKLLRRK